MTQIMVTEIDGEPGRYRVRIDQNGSESLHDVTVPDADAVRYAGVENFDISRLLEASFRFLLEREPKEAILKEFEIADIERYFPEFPSEIGAYLSS